MKNSLPILLAVFACVALPAVPLQAQVPAPPTSPQQLLVDAAEMLGQRRSIVAKLRYHAVLYGRDVIGSGDYLQGPASSRLVRYSLRMKAGAREVDFLEVNDGLYLWRRVQYEDEPDVERIEVDRILAAEQQMPAGGNPATLLTLGGLGRLLNTLARDYEFTKSLPAATLGNAPVNGIVGRIRPATLERHGVKSITELRPHVPDEVIVYLGSDDGFPYLVEFRRSEPAESRAGEGAAPESKLLLKLDLFEVRFDVPIDASQFQFAAAHLHYVDVTDRTLGERAAQR